MASEEQPGQNQDPDSELIQSENQAHQHDSSFEQISIEEGLKSSLISKTQLSSAQQINSLKQLHREE